MSSTDKVAEYREECREMGIVIEPPSVNGSEFDFVVERGSTPAPQGAVSGGNGKKALKAASAAIRFGLGAVKGVGAKAVNAIVDERRANGPYKSLFDFCKRVDLSAVNRAAIEALVCAGAFDCTGGMRKALMDSVEGAMAFGQAAQRDRRSGQMSLFGGGDGADASTLPEPALPTAEWTEAELLAREKAVLGFYITRHPLARHERLLGACATATTVDLARRKDGDEVVLGGMVSSLRTVVAKAGRNRGKRMGIVTLEDLKGRVEAVVFPDDLVKYGSGLVPDAIVFLEGSVDRKREEPSLRVSGVITLDQAVEVLSRAVLLDVTAETSMDRLTDILRSHPGNCRVYLSVKTADGMVAQIECNPSIRVACRPEFLREIIDLLGRDAVRALGPNRRAIPLPTVTSRGTPTPESAAV